MPAYPRLTLWPRPACSPLPAVGAWLHPCLRPTVPIPSVLRNRIYYRLKPLLPDRLRMWLRQRYAMRVLDRSAGRWPVLPGSERPPEGWPGWPEGKKFAVVLTHDVEGPRGLEKCRALMQLEQEQGFVSSFNFVPAGSYETPPELREELTRNGFEIGVHDLNHDGHLYDSPAVFARKAAEINRHLHEWGAVGFRSGFMLNQLDWLHQLEVAYDASTFDTDPFEPQPEGQGTNFPFWVPAPARASSSRGGYVELPYTLTQDSTLFLLLGETTPETWLRKVDWIAQHGGMVLVNVHPDYMAFDGKGESLRTYPAEFYRRLLVYLRERYGDTFWQPRPREVAAWFSEHRLPKNQPPVSTRQTAAVSPAPAPDTLRGKRAAVLLYSYYPADPRPRRAAEALVEAGMEVELFCLREHATDPTEETVGGVRIRRLPLQKRRGGKLSYMWQYGRFILASAGFLLKRMAAGRDDLVHVHNMPDALIFAAAVPKWRGARLILDLHDPMPELMSTIYGLQPDHWLVSLLRLVERWSIGFADHVLTPNIAFRDLFVSRSCERGKIDIVMNSPRQDIFDPDRLGSGPRMPSAEYRIMHHGSIVERHGVDLLVEAVARVRPSIPGVHLDIYGTRTAFLDTVMEVARAHGVEDRVHYHGPKNQAEIAEAIRACDLGVVPNRRSSFTETNFPTRLFEYLSMHRPVLAPTTRGICDYFTPDQILFFEPDDVAALAARILWAHDHPVEVQESVQKGIEVYRQHLWQEEKARFVHRVAALLSDR
jgi:glycosyltransferase involved in cell wall biosynthesis